jgi:hypothetical protein
MCWFNIVGLARPEFLVKRFAPNNPYVQPRSRKITSKIGIGIPRSQSKMYPVAAVSFILFIKRIVDYPFVKLWLEFFVCAGACFDN